MAKPGILKRFTGAIGGIVSRFSQNYDSVRWSPARGRVMHTNPADLRQEQTPVDHKEIMRTMRALDKNNAFVASYVNAHLVYAIGDGFRYQAMTDDAQWNLEAKEQIELFNQQPEVTLRFTKLQLIKMAGKAVLIDGDIFFIRTKHKDGRPALQAVEAHRVVNPDGAGPQQGWVQGIRFDKMGRPIAYGIREDDGTVVPYGAGTVIHLYDPDRFTGVRGISRLQVSITTMRDRAEVMAAERFATKEFSRRTFVLKSESGGFDSQDAGILGNSTRGPKTSASDVADAFGGLAIAIKSNESLEAFEHNRPSLNVLGLADTLDRDAAVGSGIGYDFLMNPTKIGGAVVRMELAKTERQFAAFQRMLIDGLVRKADQYAIANRIDAKVLRAVPKWERCTYNTPRKLSVDVGRDTLAMIRELEAGTRNLEDIIEENGDDAKAQIIARLDFKVWAEQQAAGRGMTYDDVSLTSILSKPAEPAQAQDTSEPDADNSDTPNQSNQ